MVLNMPVSEMDEGEPLSSQLERDHCVVGEPAAGDELAVEWPGGEAAGEPVRFDARGGGSAFRGHSVLLDAGLEDAHKGYLRVRTRPSGEAEVLLNKRGAGMNEPVHKGGGVTVRSRD